MSTRDQRPEVQDEALQAAGFRHIDPRTEPEIDALFHQLTARIDSVDPTRPCDAADWTDHWRRWTDGARIRLSSPERAPIASSYRGVR